MAAKIKKSEEEWRRELGPELYEVARKKGTEPAFTGEYWDNHEEGVYHCAACGARLFTSADKFDSGTGWPSFTRPADPEGVETEADRTMLMVRTEVHCASCGAHLGHVFDDGPRPGTIEGATGQRYCINSVCLRLEKTERE